ncbi:hypothetical protein GCM10027074_76580 [Streptomyces deserti]
MAALCVPRTGRPGLRGAGPILLQPRVHRWFDPPSQSQMTTRVPAEVPEPSASGHLLPYTRSSPASVRAHFWLALPEQSRAPSASHRAV